MKKEIAIPPHLATRLLTWFIRDDLAEGVLGDLEEKFLLVAEERSLFRARLDYWYEVVNYMRPFAIRKSKHFNPTIMVRHNLLLTIRNFKKHRSQFIINLAGLSSGIACVLFIFLWVTHEYQVEGFHEKEDRLYQLLGNHSRADGVATHYGVPGYFLEAIQSEVPEIAHTIAWAPTGEASVSVNGTYHKTDGLFASKDFFDGFSYRLLKGNPATVLSTKSGIVITSSLSDRLFKGVDPIGKPIEWHFNGISQSLVVTGIVEVPKNTDNKFDYLMSWDYYFDDLMQYKGWGEHNALITVVLDPEFSKNTRAVNMATSKINEVYKIRSSVFQDDFAKEGDENKLEFMLQKYADLYLYDNYENGKVAGGRIQYVHLFILIGIFILFIASINFINLSTAKAIGRTREIGVKKSFGASKRSLIGQYLMESVLLSMLSLAVAIMVVWSLLPYFNTMVQKDLSIGLNVEMILMALSIILLVGIVAGSYPAFYLSRLKVLTVLKGKLGDRAASAWGRKTLVVFQFTLSIILIASVMVVFYQMDYVMHKNLGYDRDNLIYFKREGKLMENHQAFIEEVKKLPGISGATLTQFRAGFYNWTEGVDWPGKTAENGVQFQQFFSGIGLIEMMGLEILEGRGFSHDFNENQSVIFNETAIAAMGLEDPIGKTIRHYTGEKKIVGVVRDFNPLSLRDKIRPMVYLVNPDRANYVIAKLNKGMELATIRKLEALHDTFNPGYIFEPKFVDQDYQQLYTSEKQISRLSSLFAALAIFISCLGLYGLISFTTERRTKEIGIRKVLGSSAFGIVYLLSIDFSRMVLVAAIIALPISYLAASNWLENFAYHIDLPWWIFLIAGLGAFLIAWLTVGSQAYKSARINPSECLKED